MNARIFVFAALSIFAVGCGSSVDTESGTGPGDTGTTGDATGTDTSGGGGDTGASTDSTVNAARFSERRFHLLHLAPELPQLVGDDERGHQDETIVAYLAELSPHRIDMRAEIFCKRDEVSLLAFAAFEPVSPAVQRDADLTHANPRLLRPTPAQPASYA